MEYAANAINQYNAKAQSIEAPKTLSSAASRLEALNGRLAKIEEALSQASSQIGALTPVQGSDVNAKATPGGAVYRLNDLTDTAHERASSIENLIASIQRTLG